MIIISDCTWCWVKGTADWGCGEGLYWALDISEHQN